MLRLVELCIRLRTPTSLSVAAWCCSWLLSRMERSAPGERRDEFVDTRAEGLWQTPVCAPVFEELLIAGIHSAR